MMKQDLFEDFVTLRWVKWTKRKPTYNGSIYIRFNSKNTGVGLVFDGKLIKLSGLANEEFSNYKNTFYWLEEIIDSSGYSDYINTLLK